MRYFNDSSPDRSAFTLVEILVTIMILSILSSLVLFAMTGALESAKKQQTKSRIAKLDREISRMWNGYLSRRVPILLDQNELTASSPSDPRIAPIRNQIQAANPQFSTSQVVSHTAATLRLIAIRDLMRLELPDRISDVLDPPWSDFNNDDNDPSNLDLAELDRPVASRAYLDVANSVKNPQQDPNDPNDPNKWTSQHQGAECLYMIVQQNVGTGRHARSFINEKEVGDVDGDKMPEFLDAWGKPIEFLRWAPGLISTKQDHDLNNPDPFDVRNVQDGTYFLYPFVFSAGPDREYDVTTDGTTPFRYRTTTPPFDPYVEFNSMQLGADVDQSNDSRVDNIDNIHNHLLETR